MATNLSAKLNIPEETAHRTKKHSTMTKGMVCMHNSGRLRGRDKLLSLALTWEPNLDRMSMPAKPAATILGSDISLSPSVIFSVTNPSREYKRRRKKKNTKQLPRLRVKSGGSHSVFLVWQHLYDDSFSKCRFQLTAWRTMIEDNEGCPKLVRSNDETMAAYFIYFRSTSPPC